MQTNEKIQQFLENIYKEKNFFENSKVDTVFSLAQYFNENFSPEEKKTTLDWLYSQILEDVESPLAQLVSVFVSFLYILNDHNFYIASEDVE